MKSQFQDDFSPHNIVFTQYCLPDGRRRQTSMDVSEATARKADEIVAAGFCFEIEILTTGHISATIGEPHEELDIVMKIMDNGPGVREKIEEMVAGFNAEEARAEIEAMQ